VALVDGIILLGVYVAQSCQFTCTGKFSAKTNSSPRMGARGSVVVKALFYKPEGRGFDSR
jgi:hypothetical protein